MVTWMAWPRDRKTMKSSTNRGWAPRNHVTFQGEVKDMDLKRSNMDQKGPIKRPSLTNVLGKDQSIVVDMRG